MTSKTMLEWVREYMRCADHPDFNSYASSRTSGADRRFEWIIHEIVRLGKIRGGRVLDIGSGFGWDSVAISILSGATVVANDIRPLMTSQAAERVAAIRKMGAPVSVETVTGDICKADLPDASFDAIVCNQTMEHVHDLEGMFRAAHRLLKPGGRAVLTNDNNVRNTRQLDEIQRMWRMRDSDWNYVNRLKEERPEENCDIEPYAVMRERIIRTANNRLDPPHLSALVDATAGMLAPEIAALAAAYSPADKLPRRPAYSWCRNPVTGEYCERQLDPVELADLLRRCGFRAVYRHGFRRFPLSVLNGVRFRALNNLLFKTRPFFMLVATREG